MANIELKGLKGLLDLSSNTNLENKSNESQMGIWLLSLSPLLSVKIFQGQSYVYYSSKCFFRCSACGETDHAASYSKPFELR